MTSRWHKTVLFLEFSSYFCALIENTWSMRQTENSDLSPFKACIYFALQWNWGFREMWTKKEEGEGGGGGGGRGGNRWYSLLWRYITAKIRVYQFMQSTTMQHSSWRSSIHLVTIQLSCFLECCIIKRWILSMEYNSVRQVELLDIRNVTIVMMHCKFEC